MRILVTGSRDFCWWNQVNEALLDAVRGGINLTIVHGDCPTGADHWADKWATYQAVRQEKHPADWNKLGKGAGPIRNQEMVDAGADICLAFVCPCSKMDCSISRPHDSHGTSSTIRMAKKAGIPVRIVRMSH